MKGPFNNSKGGRGVNTKTNTILSDAEIIELYWARSDKAITETDIKYRKYLNAVIYNILNDKLDSEEALNDTYLGAWNSIPPARPNVLKAFLVTIARRVAINRYHSNTKKRAVPAEMTVALSELEDFIADESTVDTDFDAERLGKILSEFVHSLIKRRKYIFMSRYYAASPIDTIARELNLSRSTVNKELATIRAELKEKLESEGYTI